MTSREQFEQKIKHEYGEDYLEVNDDGDYINWITSDLWECWVASRAAIEIELPELDIGYEMMEYFEPKQVIEAIESAGLKVKK